MKHPDQLALPITFEGPPDPRPKPEKRKAIKEPKGIPLDRGALIKPVQREASVTHPTTGKQSLA